MTIHVATVSHRHGTNFYAANTYEDCLRQVADFCRDWWHTEGVDGEPPEDNQDVVDQYFDYLSGTEDWSVGTCELATESKPVEVKP